MRVAVVGAGFIGPLHVEAARPAGATVVAAVALGPEGAAAAARTVGAEEGYPDLAAVLDDAEIDAEIDALYVSAPNRSHAAAARRRRAPQLRSAGAAP